MKRAFLQLHAAVFLAGFTAILGKLITLNEGLLVWYRLLITVLILGMFHLWQGKLKMGLKEAFKVMGVGLIISIHWVAFYGSVKYGNISVGVVCLSGSGFFTALLEPLLMKKRINLFELMMGILALAGIYIIFDFHPQYKTGILFGIFSALGAAIFPIFNKQLVKVHSPRVLTFLELSGGLIMLTFILPVYLTFFPAGYFLPTASDFGWLLILSVICTILAFELQLHSLKKITAFTANLTYNLEPVYGIILAFLFFGESRDFHWQFYLGLLFILMAVILQMFRVRHYTMKSHVVLMVCFIGILGV